MECNKQYYEIELASELLDLRYRTMQQQFLLEIESERYGVGFVIQRNLRFCSVKGLA